MNNVIGIVLGITDDNDPEWKYINRKGHVITCTKRQFLSYFKKRKTLTNEEFMKRATAILFAKNSMYSWWRKQGRKKVNHKALDDRMKDMMEKCERK